MKICTNWNLITIEVNVKTLINCCLRKLRPNFDGESKRWDYYTLRKIEPNQVILIERVSDDCQPFVEADISLSTFMELLGWEYCCDVLIHEFRDTNETL